MDDQHTNSMNGKGNISISLPAKQICDSHEKQAKNKDTSKMPGNFDVIFHIIVFITYTV